MRLIYGIVDNQGKVEESILWCTYRKGIPGIGSDKGWGCMIRSAQMLQAHAIHRLEAGETWSTSSPDIHIRRKFCDDANSDFSIQCFCATAMGRGVKVTQWMGPKVAALVIKDMFKRRLRVSICEDRIVYLDEVLQEGPCLLVFPMRLGKDKGPFKQYEKNLFGYMNLPQFSGILGGTPRHAMYFVGYSIDSDRALLGVDPHTTHFLQAILPKPSLKRISYSQLDPSMALTFFCRDKTDLENLFSRLEHDELISIVSTRPDYSSLCSVICED